MTRLEVFYDCSSPWTYLGCHNVQPLAAELAVEITWRPILVGGLFNTINPSVYHSRDHPVPEKQRYMHKDLQDWARLSGLEIRWPMSVFPVNSVKAMRGCIAAEEIGAGRQAAYARAVFEAYWGHDRDISRDDVLLDCAAAAGLDGAALAAAVQQPAIKDQLKANTQECGARGGFGSPTFFVDGGDMYFGNDRMPLLRAALSR
jgi:2-hydroxychromene-2-carboxylate isomerase